MLSLEKSIIMAAPIGNQFWKLRAKHGRNKLFATPDLLWEAATEYFEWCDANPWTTRKVRTRANSVEEEEAPTARPYTLSGLALYLGCSESFWKEFKKANHIDFLPIITRIEQVIETQQLEGATVGVFNHNIIARKLGLADKADLTTNGKDLKPTYIVERIATPDVSTSEN